MQEFLKNKSSCRQLFFILFFFFITLHCSPSVSLIKNHPVYSASCFSRRFGNRWATLRSHVVAFQWLPAFARRRYVRHAASPRGTDEVSRLDYAETGALRRGERDSRGSRGSVGRGSPAQSRWKPCTDSCEDASYNYRRASKPRVEFRFAFTCCFLRTFVTKIYIVLFIDRI